MIQIDDKKLELLLDRLADKIVARLNGSIPKAANELLNVKQAAEFLELSVQTMYAKVCRRELPHMKRGKRLYFSTDELIKYVEQGKVHTNEDIEMEAMEYLAKRRRP
ncbi:MAG: helix-turn-helix domain-containing protein [Cyclobacteriaceae bacterium]